MVGGDHQQEYPSAPIVILALIILFRKQHETSIKHMEGLRVVTAAVSLWLGLFTVCVCPCVDIKLFTAHAIKKFGRGGEENNAVPGVRLFCEAYRCSVEHLSREGERGFNVTRILKLLCPRLLLLSSSSLFRFHLETNHQLLAKILLVSHRSPERARR